MAEEEEVYTGELPEEAEGELEGDGEEQGGHTEQEEQEEHGGTEGEESAPKTEGEDPEKELEAMKKRLAEMEAEAAALKRMQDKSAQEMGGTSQGAVGDAASQQNKEEADARSIYVGNVDYACTPEELQQHFQECGTVNRVTILADAFGQPKGYAYVEFVDTESVPLALQYNESELHGRQIKVTEKRTNIPGLKMHRGRPRGYNFHYRPRRPSYGGYGRVPRYRRPTRYRPYY
ncbi:polyadenylate-binding protein 2 [Klebsormidium nitens]|uniref:Polyadenylate-binding protein 2 n=1 Tax=Klebsormidium nitens TaxID=105231 RepID=A0A1Y1IX70_KLENI|nr:polyadenylate-binding protein 2 [Klebsormidium nitens]|eukprot:GAQ92868.1 polyadenylate-binding protein 2 [Klebsormidium nitens]